MQSNFPQIVGQVPAGLILRQTITSTGAVTLPSNLSWVYAILIGGGGGGGNASTGAASGGGGGAGAFVQGWTPVSSICTIGAGGTGGISSTPASYGGMTIFGNLMAGGGGYGGNGGAGSAGYLGGSGGLIYAAGGWHSPWGGSIPRRRPTF